MPSSTTCFAKIASSHLQINSALTPSFVTNAYADADRDPRTLARDWPASSSGRGRGIRCSTGSRLARSGSRRQLNASVNCVDRHARGPRRNKAAIIWEGEPGDRRTLTYFDLQREVSKCANVLKSLGTKKGDRVALYMPLVPELAIAMLACARIGAVHSVVFGGFSAESLRDRINDAEARLLVTADGGFRRGQIVQLKQVADEAVAGTPSIEHVVVFKRGCDVSIPVTMKEGRDHWYHELMAKASSRCDAEAMDAEDMLYILYTSGTTGKPKGIIHTTGGYMVGTYATTKMVFDLKED